MYNLIVAGGTRNSQQSTISNTRVFEHTTDEISVLFKPEGELDTQAVMNLPTLFMQEGTGDEIARLGWLSRIALNGGNYEFHYMFDPGVPPMTNAEVFSLSTELRMDDWEFSRNHWAIKDVDLSYVLLSQRSTRTPTPTVFQLSDNPVSRNLVSLMMPFSGDFDRTHTAIKATVEAEGYECRRADDFWLHAHIIQDIIELICTSSVVICDLSGKNPNVFYEVGRAHV